MPKSAFFAFAKLAIAPLLLLSLAPASQAAGTGRQTLSQCESKASNQEITQCLNQFAETALQVQSPADLRYQERLSRILRKYDLRTSQVKTSSLAESFQIIVEGQMADTSKPCFDFTYLWQRNRTELVRQVEAQIQESALFLSEIHAKSLGHQVSLLFPIKEVSLCSLVGFGNRGISFEQRTLKLGLGNSVIRQPELLKAWNSGNPIRSTDLSWYNSIPYLGSRLRLLAHGPEAVLRDKFADNWMVLNPTGNLRTTALYTLAETILRLKDSLGGEENDTLGIDTKRKLLESLIEGPGFQDSDRAQLQRLFARDQDIAHLYSLFRQKLFSPANILTVIENAIGDQARRNSTLHATLRKISSGVAVVNDKNIVVRLEQFMHSSIPVSDFEGSARSRDITIEFRRVESTTDDRGRVVQNETSLKTKGLDPRDVSINADEISAWTAIDLIDNVVVSVQVPNISPAAYKRVCLYQALQELIPSSIEPH